MKEFKVGDRVVVVMDATGANPEAVGKTGIVTGVLPKGNIFTGFFPGVYYNPDGDSGIGVALNVELELLGNGST